MCWYFWWNNKSPNPRIFLHVPHIEIVDEMYRSTRHAPKFCIMVPSTLTINYRSILLHWTQVNGTALKCIPKEPDWGPDPLIQVESGYAGYSFVESWTKADDNWWNAGSSNALVMMSASRDFVWHSLIIVPLDNLLQIWQAYSNLSCMVIISKLWTHDVTGCVVTRSD